MSPLVSVIIPTYNCAKYIGRAIQSVINQHYRSFEIIVVDDGSMDDTSHVIGKLGDDIKYIYQKNQGPSAARNTGIRNANGGLIAFLDADDEWLPEKLAFQVEAIQENARIGIVSAQYGNVNDTVEQSRAGSHPHQCNFLSFNQLYVKNSLLTSSLLIRRECFDKVGLFDNSLKFGEDWEMWLRIANNYKICILSDILCKYQRNRQGSITSSYSTKNMRDWLAIIERYKEYSSNIHYRKSLSWYYFNYSYIESMNGNRHASLSMLSRSSKVWPFAIYNQAPVLFRWMRAVIRQFLNQESQTVKSK